MAGAPEILLFTVDAGGGHRAAARAVAAAVEETRPPFRLRVESFQQLLLPLDVLRRLSGVAIEDFYNVLQRRHWNVAMSPLLRVLHATIRLRRGAIHRLLVRWFREQPPPAAVVAVMPHFNGILREALREARPGVPLVVVLTDLADFPPRFWIEPGLDRVVVGTDEARAQALALGIAADHVSLVSGMVLHPRFYRAAGEGVREAVRRELGFAGEDFVAMLLFGGKGTPEILPLARALLEADPTLRVLAVCGDNPQLEARVRELASGSSGRLAVFGFSERVAELLSASDLLLTKPGPGSLAEAFQRRVPVVVERNIHTIPQERFNTDFVTRRGLGLVVGHWREMPKAVARLRRDAPALAALRARIAALPENRAVFEVVEILAREARAAPG